MKFLVIAAMYPPNNLGGAEISAQQRSRWLMSQGHEVSVLMTAKDPSEEWQGKDFDGIRVWSVYMPRPYPFYYAARGNKFEKVIWHLQDHFDPRNKKVVADVLDTVKPDFVNVHFTQGIGYNALTEIAKRKIPTAFYLHDLSFVCFHMAMFKKGHECKGQCTACVASTKVKQSILDQFEKAVFISPSAANLRTVEKYMDLSRFQTRAILNANKYPAPSVERVPSDIPRLVYVGRLHEPKGINFLLSVLKKLSATHRFKLKVLGTGPDGDALKAEYGSEPWVEFVGHVSQQEVIDTMQNTDLLCIPSLWAENSPGVVIQAFSIGLPVFGSDKGGIPELVENDYNGLLLPPGDGAAWEGALEKALESPDLLNRFRENADKDKQKFDQDYLGNEAMALSMSITGS